MHATARCARRVGARLASRVRMRVHAAIAGLVFLAGCDGSILEPLRADLALSPDDVALTSWIGFTSRASFTASNSGRAALDVDAPLLAPIEGLDLLEGREVLDGTTVSVAATAGGTPLADDDLRIESGGALFIDVTLSPTREGTSTLILVVTPEDGEIAAASATIALDARLPPVCTANGPCDTVVFDPAVGACVHTARPEGSACSDASACTTDDRCSQGACVGEALTCGDAVDCTVDACDPSVGCVFTPVHDRCADENPCTNDVCVAASGCSNDTAPDGTLCGPFSCAELSTCFFGACVHAPTPDGFPCEDGDLCTSGDACVAHECVPGEDVDPVAQSPVALRPPPTLHVPYEARWFTRDIGDSSGTGADGDLSVPAADIDVDVTFDAVLDIAQGIVGARPTLAVVWRSQPFNVDGTACAPWDTWADDGSGTLPPASDGDPTFCASAVVVTFVDEIEMRDAATSGSTAGAGTSVVLDVVYGTAGAAFAARAPGASGVMDDALRVLLVESSYASYPDPGREVRMTRATLSFAARAVVEQSEELLSSGPSWDLSHNVHAGMRVAADDDGETVIGWDLPYAPLYSTNAAASDDAEPDRAAIDVPVQWRASIDIGAITAAPPGEYGDVTWSEMIDDSCAWSPAASEENAWLDVDVARAAGRSWAIARHRDQTDGTNGCEPDGVDALQLSAIEIDDDDGPTITWQLGLDVRSASLTDRASVLARLHERDLECAGCAPYTLDMLPQPFDPSPDPSVQLETVTLDTSEGFPVRVAALDDDAGFVGAVLVERDIYTNQHRVRLIDAVDGNVVAIDLASPFFDAPGVMGAGRVRALRSPLSPQRVYAVLPAADAGDFTAPHGAVVSFGCPFPTLP